MSGNDKAVPLPGPTGRGDNTLDADEAERLRHPKVDVAALEKSLRTAVRGEVRFDAGSRALYSTDASNYRQVPLGVVIPHSVEDLTAAVGICHEYGAPILARGGGTSQNGQCVNVAVVLDLSKCLNRVLEIDPVSRTALVEPGVVCDELRTQAEQYGLTFGPDPATHSRCTLGGMIGNNSCGAHSVMAGKTLENVEALEVLTADGVRLWVGPTTEAEIDRLIHTADGAGRIYQQLKALRDRYAAQIRNEFPDIRRRVSGYNLDQLLPEHGFNVARALVGTEGTCAITLRARVRLVASPKDRVLLVMGYPDIYQAAEACPGIMEFGPIALEGLDESIISGLTARGLLKQELQLLPPGKGWLLVEFGANSPAAAAAQAGVLVEAITAGRFAATHVLCTDPGQQAKLWTIRELGASATAMSQSAGEADPIVGWEDAAVDPVHLGPYLRSFQALVDEFGYRTSLYGHFGDGCVHARINFSLRTQEGLRKTRAFLERAADLVVKFGGSLSGEHGDGQAKAEFLPRMFSPQLIQAFHEFKAIWDPANRLNPGKVVNSFRFDENLRLGPSYRPALVESQFSYPALQGTFTRAVEHCIGMGRCRSLTGGTMCPSYRATREEKYSTRGRSRLLFEMLGGEVIKDGWKSAAVREALDHCLACKGCKSDCPTHVDMATLKADFLSRYYKGRMRPLQAYAFGRIDRWARLAGFVPRLVNWIMRGRASSALIRTLLNVDPRRALPVVANQTFVDWFHSRRRPDSPGREVILWPDTFTNHFQTDIARDAVEVLERLGYSVRLPAIALCCGRPLYDFGMVDEARAKLQLLLSALRSDIRAGIPIVGLEPACISVFRDELLNLFPHDDDARRLSKQTHLFSEFVLADGTFRAPQLDRKALVHLHCHQKAVIGADSDRTLLRALGVTVLEPESGCCGMSGSFGFDKHKYDISQKIGERALLPAVRAAAPEMLIVASGYSCREQISQATGREPMHIAQVLKMAFAADELRATSDASRTPDCRGGL